MTVNDTTTGRGYQKPNPANLLSADVLRLRAALDAIDADMVGRYTKTEVDALIAGLVNGAPGALDTLDELAAALGDDSNFGATVTTALANRYTKAESDARYVQGTTQTEMVFTAGTSQTAYTLTTGVINKASALVSVDGILQPTSEYSLSMDGLTLTLSEAPAAGAKVRVLALGAAGSGAPGDDTVTTVKLRDGAVTTAKLAAGAATPADGSITTAKLADAAVTAAKIASGPLAVASFQPTSSTAPTNGVYLPAANTVGIAADGTGRVTVDTTTAPFKEVFSGTFHPVVTAVDVGTAADQVPLNYMLGNLAFMDDIARIRASVTTPSNNLDINFEYVSNTSIRIRMRGSDGVVRSTTLTLS